MDRATLNFMDRALAEIPGALPRLDAYVLLELSRIQAKNGIRGDILEIGAAYGASAVMLARHLQDRERLIVCDLFGSAADTPLNKQEQQDWGYDQLERKVFEENFLRFCPFLPEIWQHPSNTLIEAELRSLRLAHIDGSHMYANVREDLELVRAHLAPTGVAVFDDVFTGHAPGVGAAVWPELVSGLRPFLSTSQKLYAAWGPPPVEKDELHAILSDYGAQVFEDDIADNPIVIARERKQPTTVAKSVARDVLPPAVVRMFARLRR